MSSISEAQTALAAMGIVGLIIGIAIMVAAIVAWLLAISMFIDAAKAKGYHRTRGAGLLWFMGIFATPIAVGLYAAALPDRQLREAVGKNPGETASPAAGAGFAKPQPVGNAYPTQKPPVNPAYAAQRQQAANPGFATQQSRMNPGYAGQQPISNPGFAGQQPTAGQSFAGQQRVSSNFGSQDDAAAGAANQAQGDITGAVPLQTVNVSATPLTEHVFSSQMVDGTIPRV